GAAAFAAALYAARYQMRTIVIGEMFGGETATGGLIENYPGYPEIDGYDLMLKFREQAEKYEVPIVDGKVESIDRTAHCFEARTDSGETYRGTTVILAVGRERRKLGLQHEDEWIGKGVSFCSTCDAPLHRGNVVAVVGGGDAAVKGAVLLSKYAERVYIVYRGVAFTRPEAANLRLLEQSGNVERLFNTNVIELKGNDGLSAIVLDQEVNGSTELAVNGIFIEIGADPRTELAHQLGILLNDRDEIIVDKHMGTNVHGVFAAGDVTDAGGDLKQTLTAAAQGALAATAAYADVSEHPEACAVHARGFSLV
ncbi:MAG: FAD-dependent oxidoreductase, partial [Chloroflexi bacterium]|nr:FAD-dependent oxidoreductase [Chloroflexota bacterium]MCI0791902.1 FAD-dependent oxidoreductase [Chloroflexota bacterium]MCI0797304.1 FAD-dependent oxidoreductase [Chloroflexota bacterium]MCI0867557.1 FAD-dependent oxidoreductase [Chloroflexota bacterium]